MENIYGSIRWDMIFRTFFHKLVGEPVIDEDHFDWVVLLGIYHYILWLQVVICTVWGMNYFQNVDKLDTDRNELSISLQRWSFEVTEEFLEVVAVFRHYIVRALSIFLGASLLVREVLEHDESVTDDAWHTSIVRTL